MENHRLEILKGSENAWSGISGPLSGQLVGEGGERPRGISCLFYLKQFLFLSPSEQKVGSSHLSLPSLNSLNQRSESFSEEKEDKSGCPFSQTSIRERNISFTHPIFFSILWRKKISGNDFRFLGNTERFVIDSCFFFFYRALDHVLQVNSILSSREIFPIAFHFFFFSLFRKKWMVSFFRRRGLKLSSAAIIDDKS